MLWLCKCLCDQKWQNERRVRTYFDRCGLRTHLRDDGKGELKGAQEHGRGRTVVETETKMLTNLLRDIPCPCVACSRPTEDLTRRQIIIVMLTRMWPCMPSNVTQNTLPHETASSGFAPESEPSNSCGCACVAIARVMHVHHDVHDYSLRPSAPAAQKTAVPSSTQPHEKRNPRRQMKSA